jgi:hypothetical protein
MSHAHHATGCECTSCDPGVIGAQGRTHGNG